jgi:hypothetical protein
MITGFDKGSKGSTVLVVFCPQKGPSLRQQFVSRVMAEAGYDVLAKPVPIEICALNPVHVVVDEWPMTERNLMEPEA